MYVSYDGVTFSVLQLESWSREAVYDKSGRDWLFWHHRLTVKCILSAVATAASRFPPVPFAVGNVNVNIPPGPKPGPGENPDTTSSVRTGGVNILSTFLDAAAGVGAIGINAAGSLLIGGLGFAGQAARILPAALGFPTAARLPQPTVGPLPPTADLPAIGAAIGGAAIGPNFGQAVGSILGQGTNRPAVGAPGQVLAAPPNVTPQPRTDIDAFLRPGQTREEFFAETDAPNQPEPPPPGTRSNFGGQSAVPPPPGAFVSIGGPADQNTFGGGGDFLGAPSRPPRPPFIHIHAGPGSPGPTVTGAVAAGATAGIISNSPTVPWTDVEIRARLARPRRPLWVWLHTGSAGAAEFMLISPHLGCGVDALGGPICTTLDVPEVHGVQSAVMRLQFETWEASPPQYTNVFGPAGGRAQLLATPALMSNRWEMSFGWDPDTYLRSQTIKGTATFRQDVLASKGLTADELRKQLWHPIPAGYQRRPPEVSLNGGGDSVEYAIVDDQVLMNNPGGARYGVIKVEAEQAMEFTGVDSPYEAK